MSQSTVAERKAPEVVERTSPPRSLSLIWAFACLLLLELAAFGLNVKHVGVYQDEWIYFNEMHFTQHSLKDLVSVFFFDPRALVRPLEALHFPILYYFVWEKPLWYHLVCYFCEFWGGWFLFLAVSKLAQDRRVGLVAAALFLLFPNHDSTHYYITASSEQISASFFTLSLWLFIKALDESKTSLVALSAAAYFASLYSYEQTLPLMFVYPLVTFMRKGLSDKSLAGYIRFASLQIPFLAVAASMVVYRSWLLPSLKLGYHYATVYNFSNFMKVMVSGINVCLSPSLAIFSIQNAAACVNESLSPLLWILLLASAGLSAVVFARDLSPPKPEATNLWLICLGAISLLLSYTIFGFSPEHMPILDGWRNRVNICGSLSASLIFAGIFGLALGASTSRLWRSVLALIVSVIVGTFLLADWQLAKPWIVSWDAQKALIGFVDKHKKEIMPGDTIILGGVIRYVGWAPVVDGIWDFQSIVRTTLNSSKVNANVITERLHVGQNELIDREGRLVLGKYPYKQLILYVPQKSYWKRVSSREEFVREAGRLGFTLPAEN